MFDLIKNKTIYANKYQTHSEAMIVSCFFNPQNSPYRIKAFKMFHESIKHLNHRIIECVIGDSKPQLEENKNIQRVYTDSLLWHKEALLNKIIAYLPAKYKYIFWVDADVIFTNKNWLVDGVKKLEYYNIIQPFEYCVHLNKDQVQPEFDLPFAKATYYPKGSIVASSKRLWRSFSANCVDKYENACSENYDVHGHVGFAWGAKREVLDKVPLYDRALIGGADHIIAHAAAGQIPHSCITKSFTENIDEVNKWSDSFFAVVKGRIGYVQGDLFHIWHGDIENRDYLKRIQEFTPKTKNIVNRDSNGLFIANKQDEAYVKNYFKKREVVGEDSFLASMAIGYMTDSTVLGAAIGGDLVGAAIGDMLNSGGFNATTDFDTKQHDFGGFGGSGNFDGGGAGDSWEDKQSHSHDYNQSDNEVTPISTFS